MRIVIYSNRITICTPTPEQKSFIFQLCNRFENVALQLEFNSLIYPNITIRATAEKLYTILYEISKNYDVKII